MTFSFSRIQGRMSYNLLIISAIRMNKSKNTNRRLEGKTENPCRNFKDESRRKHEKKDNILKTKDKKIRPIRPTD